MVFNNTRSLTTIRQGAVSKLALGSASLMMLAVMGTSGAASAAQLTKPSKADCVKAGFTNYGQCVKEWAHSKNHGGGGYGGGNNNNVHTNITVNQNHSNHNILSIAINYLFG